MPWPNLRKGLLQDLGYTTPEALAETLHYPNIQHLKEALDGAQPEDDLMTALLRTYPAVPAMYFVERGASKVEAA